MLAEINKRQKLIESLGEVRFESILATSCQTLKRTFESYGWYHEKGSSCSSKRSWSYFCWRSGWTRRSNWNESKFLILIISFSSTTELWWSKRHQSQCTSIDAATTTSSNRLEHVIKLVIFIQWNSENGGAESRNAKSTIEWRTSSASFRRCSARESSIEADEQTFESVWTLKLYKDVDWEIWGCL